MHQDDTYFSWGGLSVQPRIVVSPASTAESHCPALPYLPVGNGRSYGDTCLPAAAAIASHRMKTVLAFDEEAGIVRAESGLLLAELLDLIIPHGWFLPVTPGTRWVSLGGALANDVHGKNHHGAGTFGCHVRRFELVRSDGTRHICSASENAGLFRATIGGMGLTGFVT